MDKMVKMKKQNGMNLLIQRMSNLMKVLMKVHLKQKMLIHGELRLMDKIIIMKINGVNSERRKKNGYRRTSSC